MFGPKGGMHMDRKKLHVSNDARSIVAMCFDGKGKIRITRPTADQSWTKTRSRTQLIF